MKSTTLFSWAALAATHLVGTAAADPTAAQPSQTPSTLPKVDDPTSQGCWHSKGNMTSVPVTDMSSGVCIKACKAKQYWVSGLQGSSCYCGFAYPPEDSYTTDNSKCNYPCPNYPLEACGSLGSPGYFSVFNLGININVPYYEPPASSSTSSAAAATTSSIVASSTAPPTVAPTTPAPVESTTAASHKSGGTNTAAIAAGVVSGVVVIAAIIAGSMLYMRRKRNAEVEEEHRRNAAVNAFISGSKPPSSSGSISMTDSRLDPVMAHRRLSDGSIADNQDYSRRILRVTNA